MTSGLLAHLLHPSSRGKAKDADQKSEASDASNVSGASEGKSAFFKNMVEEMKKKAAKQAEAEADRKRKAKENKKNPEQAEDVEKSEQVEAETDGKTKRRFQILEEKNGFTEEMEEEFFNGSLEHVMFKRI